MKNDIVNINQLTVEDTEHYTVLRMLHKLVAKINELVYANGDIYDKLNYLLNEGLSEEVVKALTDWLNDGTLSDIITEQVLVEIDSRLDAIENNTPYRDYDRNETGIGYGENNNKIYEGFSQFTKKTYGRYEQGTAVSIMANADNPKPELTGTDTKGLSWYVGRDSCALYIANSAGQPALTIPADLVIYNANGCVLPVNTDMSQIKVGMILDTEGHENVNWYVGIVKEIKGTTLILEDGWYLVRTDGVESSKGVPSNVGLRINWISKIWNIDSNMFIHPGCPAGANMELGIFCEHSYINDVGGIDLINLGGYGVNYGMKVRHKDFNDGFAEAYLSDDNKNHFVAWTSEDKISEYKLLRSMQKGNNAEIFSIGSNGLIKGQRVDWEVVSSNKKVENGKSVVIITDSCNLDLPSGEGGRFITIMVLTSNNVLLTAPNGMQIRTFGTIGQQVNISKVSKKQRVITLFSDGGTWYFMSDNEG